MAELRKNKSVKDMTNGNTSKLLLQFALPVFLSQVFQQLYNTADAYIVGKFLGTDALAAVSSSGTLIFLLISFFTGVSMGAGVVISKYFGAGDADRVSKAIHTNIAFGLSSGIILTVVGVLFTPTFLRWMQTDEEIMPLAVEYFKYYFFGSIAVVMYNICRSIMNALGDSRRPLYYLIFSSLVNIGLDLLFIAVFEWGVWAAAIATVLSQMASVVLCMAHLMEKGNLYTVRIRDIRFDKQALWESIKYGLPAGVQNSVIGFANVIVQSQINTFGKLATAAYGTHAKIEGFAFLPITSFTMACTTFVSQNLGAKQYERAKKGARFSIFASMLIAEGIGVIMFTAAPFLIGLFDQTPGVLELGTRQLRTLAPFYFLLAFSHAIAAICRGAGKAFVPMTVMLAIWCVVRIIYIALVMNFLGDIKFIYWAYPFTWSLSSLIYLIYYLKCDWVHGFEKKAARNA